MKALNPTGLSRPILAMLSPLVAFILQSMFWPAIRPYVWLLFYPTVFFSSWIGGLPSGLMATVISTALVWWAFIPPEYSFMMKNPQNFLSAAVFMGMGVLFSLFHGRLRKANKQAAEALAAVSSANDQLETRVQERAADLARSNELLRTEMAQRKRAEEKIRLQSAALESAANAVVITGRDGIITWVNPAFTKLTGYSPEEAIGQNPRLLKSGTQDRPFYENLWNTILSGQVWSGEIVNRRKDGVLYTEEQMITPVRSPEGDITHFIAIKQNITDRKRAEKERARLISVIEATTDLVGISDPQGHLFYLNKNGRKMLGISEDEDISGFQVSDSHPEPARKLVFEKAIPTAIREGVWQGENTLLTRDGREIPVLQVILAHRALDGSVEFLSTIIRNITERKQAEEEIQRNLERIHALHEIDKAITSTLDLHGTLHVLLEKIDLVLPYAATTVRLFNPGNGLLEPVACRNLDEKEWKTEAWRGGRGLANVAFETNAPIIIRNAQTDPRVRDPEFYQKHKLISYLGIPLIAKEKTLGVLGFYTKQEHDFSNDEVEFLSTLAGQAAIAIHNAQLYEQMARANKIKDEFLSVMSHELRTPLNVVVGYTGMIMDGMLGEVNDKQKEALEKVINRTNDQLAMVNNILYATVLESESVAVETQDFNLEDFLNQLKQNYEAPINKELSLDWDYPFGLPNIRTDSAKLKHILRNLIDNALKFTAKGSVTIKAGIRQQMGDHQLRNSNFEIRNQSLTPAWVEFKVSDTGVGIPKDALPFVFDKFRQLDSSETRLYGGVGMGLYIVKKFTELLGGTVEVESEAGKGSTFTVRIPCGQ